MAKAKRKKRIVEEVIKKEINDGITLELSDVEAKCILLALGACTGNAPYNVFQELKNIYGRIDKDYPNFIHNIIDINSIEDSL